MNIAVSKQEAISRLTANRNKFEGRYAIALSKYQQEIVDYAKAFLEWAEAGAVPEERPKEPTRPYNKTHLYEALIRKLSVIVTSVVELSDYEYKQIYDDTVGDIASGIVSTGQLTIC